MVRYMSAVVVVISSLLLRDNFKVSSFSIIGEIDVGVDMIGRFVPLRD